MKKNKEIYGAQIERGTVTEINGETYRVKSMDRYGVTSGALKSLSGAFEVGDAVYFCMFDDGKGFILAGV